MTDDLLRDRVVAAIGDRYVLDGEVGRGALSVVYRARDVRLDRPVAIKVLPPDAAFRPAVRARFLREAETAARLAHPNIVPIFAIEDGDGVAAIVMAFVEGESLAARLARAPMPSVEEALGVLRDVADGLAYAHAQGVVHRDVKPDNILLERGSGRALLTDFGIARAMEGGDQVTATGVAVGTPAYMSPEQALGEEQLDPRTDVYALGMVAWQLLAGTLPFQASSAAGMLMKQIGEPLPSLAARRPELPAGVVAAVERALAKRRDDRWPGVAAFAAALAEGHTEGHTEGHAEAHAAEARRDDDEAPRFPPYPPAGDAAARDAWREATRRWRESVRSRRDAAMRALGPEAPVAVSQVPMRPLVPPLQDAAALPTRGLATAREREEQIRLAARIRAFRASVTGFGVFVGGGALANAALAPDEPVMLLPGMLWGLWMVRHVAGLRRRGLGAVDALTGADPRVGAALDAEVAAGGEGGLSARVAGFTRAATVAGALAVGTVAAGLAYGATDGDAALAIAAAGIVATFVIGMAAIRRGVLVRAAGIGLRDAWQGRWREAFRRRRPALAARLLAESMAQQLPAEVRQGPFGAVVQQAAQDRADILETLAQLGDADRAMLPDVLPTVQHLEERIVSVATSLHRMSADVTPAQLRDAEQRLAAAQGGPPGSERDRTVSLLSRQVETLRDLLERRSGLEAQLDGAVLLLTTLKLDLLRLRSAGAEGVLADVTTATQEARALSVDIGAALEVAGALRRR